MHTPRYRSTGYDTFFGSRSNHSIVTWVKQAFRTNVISLTNTTLPARLERREKWLVYFYSSRCMYCRATLPYFREASVRSEFPTSGAGTVVSRTPINPSTTVQYGTVDCTKYRQLCNELKVSIFPHVAYYDRMYDKSVNMYAQEKNVYFGSMSNPKEIAAFAVQMVRSPVNEVDPETIENHVYRTHSLWMVSFSAGGWCGPCTQLRPVYADAAYQLCKRCWCWCYCCWWCCCCVCVCVCVR